MTAQTVQIGRPEVRAGEETLSMHCALDALMLPFVLGRPIELRSRSPLDGALVEVAADRSSVRAVPEQAVLSLGLRLRGGGGVQQRCCPLINLFPSREDYERWAAGRRGALLTALPVERGYALARALGSLWRAAVLARRSAGPVLVLAAGILALRRLRRSRRR